MWEAVDALIARAPGPGALTEHRLHLLAASRAQRSGGAPDPGHARDRILAAAVELSVPVVLGAVRAAWDGRLVLLKGPEVARRYPAPATRPYGDLDLLTTDPEATQRALLHAGFREIGEPALYTGIHHLRPLWLPGTPLTVELHAWPKWPAWSAPPRAEELLEAAVPGSVGAEGIEVLPPEHHAIVLAAHSWAHVPLARAGHLVDIAAVLADADAAQAAALARRWGCGRMWRTTSTAVGSLLGGDRCAATAIWARHLLATRERTVLEAHAEAWLSPLWGVPLRRAPGAVGAALAGDLLPESREGWRAKLARSGRAVVDARLPRSDHERALEARR